MASLVSSGGNGADQMQHEINILAMHGKRQNAPIFENRCDKLVKKFQKGQKTKDGETVVVKFHFLDAPNILEIEKGDSVATRSWFDGKEDRGSKAVDTVSSEWNRGQTKFDGLFGFSEGSCVILLCCLAKEARFPGLKFVICASGLVPDFANSLCHSLIEVPSLHIYGMADSAVPPKLSIMLSRCFLDPTIHAHTKNHRVSQSAKDLLAISDFIFGIEDLFLRDIGCGEPFEINEDIEDEIEALSSIYAETKEFFLDTQNPPVMRVKVSNDICAITIKFSLGPKYPFEAPCNLKIQRSNDSPRQLQTRQMKKLERYLLDEAEKNVGCPMIFTVVECCREWLDNEKNVTDDGGVTDTTSLAKQTSVVKDDNAESDEDTTENAILAWIHRNEDLTSEGIMEKMLDMAEDINAALKEARILNDENLYKSPSQKGLWNYCLGLVGKPSAGKSTFFNASINSDTTKPAVIGAYPFTTIEPNFGLANVAIEVPQGETGPEENQFTDITIRIKDVAGLVPGAYVGRGKGNRFLNDLLDADVLIHVVDVSGESDSSGNIGGKGDPMEDIVWVHKELHMWIYFNVIHKWQAILRRPEKFVDMFAGYHATPDFIYEALRRCGIDNVDSETIYGWTPLDLHKIIAHFIELRFPIFLCLNKVDKLDARKVSDNTSCDTTHENIRNIAAEFSNARFHPACAKDGFGVKPCIKKAMQLRLPHLVFPVKDFFHSDNAMHGLVSRTRFGDCLPFKHGSTVENVYTCLCRENALFGEFVRAEILTSFHKEESKLVKKTETLQSICSAHKHIVIIIATNKRKQWQKKNVKKG